VRKNVKRSSLIVGSVPKHILDRRVRENLGSKPEQKNREERSQIQKNHASFNREDRIGRPGKKKAYISK